MDRVLIVPYTFLRASSELSEDVCLVLQKLERRETLCGLSTGHPVCRATPQDARALGQLKQILIWKSIKQGSNWATLRGRKGEERGRVVRSRAASR